MVDQNATPAGEKTSWFREELARAKARNEAVPEQAQMVVVGSLFFTERGAETEAGEGRG